jgi:tetraacyldisaccharide 4'-kinase
VPHEEPSWWYGSGTVAAVAKKALAPAAAVYGAVAKNRYRHAATYRSSLPVICVGNFTAGGAGKTPLTLHLLQQLKSDGETPVVLSRGYGGTIEGPEFQS